MNMNSTMSMRWNFLLDLDQSQSVSGQADKASAAIKAANSHFNSNLKNLGYFAELEFELV